jgi:hypothetical protein
MPNYSIKQKKTKLTKKYNNSRHRSMKGGAAQSAIFAGSLPTSKSLPTSYHYPFNSNPYGKFLNSVAMQRIPPKKIDLQYYINNILSVVNDEQYVHKNREETKLLIALLQAMHSIKKKNMVTDKEYKLINEYTTKLGFIEPYLSYVKKIGQEFTTKTNTHNKNTKSNGHPEYIHEGFNV